MAAATSVVTNSYHTKPPCELTTSISPASLSAALSRRAAQGAGRTRDRFIPRSSCPTVDWLTPGSTAVRRCAQRNSAACLLVALLRPRTISAFPPLLERERTSVG